MASASTAVVLRQFRALFGAGTVAGLTDGQLLERFLGGRGDEAESAFAALVARHGPMVLGVCRRALPDPNDAEDAFQATFLVLVRRGASVRVDDSLGRWLYGVSRKVAARARSRASRRRWVDLADAGPLPAASGHQDRLDAAMALDEELARLAEPFRSAVLLCDVGGLTHEEAARDLRCPVGTVKSRLARGRERLRGRLTRRGLAPLAALLAAEATAPAALIEATVRVAMFDAAKGTAAVLAAGMVPASTLALTQGVLPAMTHLKLTAAAVVLTLGLAATGAVVLARSGPGDDGQPGAEPKAAVAAETPRDPDRPERAAPRWSPDDPKNALEGQRRRLKRAVELSRDPNDPAILRAREDLAQLEATLAQMIRDLTVVLGETSRPTYLDELKAQLDRDLKRLDDARRMTRDPNDPAIIMAEKTVALSKEAIAQFARDPAFLRDEAPKTARAARPTVNPRGAATQPPREFSKVSMPEYVVEPPDMIRVEVLKALDGRPITGAHVVRPDGKISLGFYGAVYVAGLTMTEVKEKVILHLRDYLTDDQLGLRALDHRTNRAVTVAPAQSTSVFVDVTAYNSMVYYVQGDVGSPGRLPITGNETVLDAINYAGGLIPTSSVPNIRLVRPAPPGASGEQVLPVNLAAIMEKGDSTTNYQMMPGDRLIVPRDPTAVEPKPTESPKVVVSQPTPPPVGDQEARLREVERKLDLILKKLDEPKKP